MEIASPDTPEWDVFLRLAEAEGWRVPPAELELYRGPLMGSAFVLREGHSARGFVTAVGHEKSGWIGNLLVDPELRGRGLGTLLFDHALEVLRRQVDTIWLTASPMGRPLYEKRGFRVLDGVVRWVRKVSEPAGEVRSGDSIEPLLEGDAQVWGESRARLLLPLAMPGNVFAAGGTVALLQAGEGMRVLGPWLSDSLCPRENRQVLTAVLEAAGAGTELVTDVPESSPVSSLLAGAGFEAAGRCDLMALGPSEGTHLQGLVSLASLGSMG